MMMTATMASSTGALPTAKNEKSQMTNNWWL